MYGIRLGLKTTITGDTQIEIIGAPFILCRKIVVMSSLAIGGVGARGRAQCACVCVGG